MSFKKCSKCGNYKSLLDFSKRKASKDGLNIVCKKCDKLLYLKYSRSKKGVASTIYSGQKQSCKTRKMANPKYTKQEFAHWLLSKNIFIKLYDNWVQSGYETTLKPSVDRIDDYKSYSFDNIQLMTWGENRSKSHHDRKMGINHKKSKRVIQSDKTTGEFIDIFNSPALAARELNVNQRVIDYCCNNALKFIGGFNFRYVD